MDWYNKKKISGGVPSYSPSSYGSMGSSGSGGGLSPYQNQRNQIYSHASNSGTGVNSNHIAGGGSSSGLNYHPLIAPNGVIPSSSPIQQGSTSTTPVISDGPMDRTSYYFSQYPLYCSDWAYLGSADKDWVALSSYKEGFSNKLQILHGIDYGQDYTRGYGASDPIVQDEIGLDNNSPTSANHPDSHSSFRDGIDDNVVGFDFHKVAEANLDYPITNLQWDPSMKSVAEQRIAASSEVLRLYKLGHDSYDHTGEQKLVQTHILANNTSGNTSISSNSSTSASTLANDINTFPPVTSFDWNKTDPNIIITSSVDTTCTVWDLHRSHNLQKVNEEGSTIDSATVMTQLIAHDSEVFDVKFIHNSSNIFASVGNDGSMRVFDLRSLEHSTIIYEPTLPISSTTPSGLSSTPSIGVSAMNAKALLKLSTSNIDQHHLATVGINSNQVIIIDMRMPGLPVATLDGSLGGINHAAINSIKWHPTSNHLLTGGDDCQALIWDCNYLDYVKKPAGGEAGGVVDTPVLAYEEDLEVNNVTWRQGRGDWMGVVSGKGFQAVHI